MIVFLIICMHFSNKRKNYKPFSSHVCLLKTYATIDINSKKVKIKEKVKKKKKGLKIEKKD